MAVWQIQESAKKRDVYELGTEMGWGLEKKRMHEVSGGPDEGFIRCPVYSWSSTSVVLAANI